jgi:hypothetical protein
MPIGLTCLEKLRILDSTDPFSDGASFFIEANVVNLSTSCSQVNLSF